MNPLAEIVLNDETTLFRQVYLGRIPLPPLSRCQNKFKHQKKKKKLLKKKNTKRRPWELFFFYFFASSKCALQLEGPHLDRLGKIQVARSCRHARPLSLSFSLSITCRLFVSARRDKGRHKINEHQLAAVLSLCSLTIAQLLLLHASLSDARGHFQVSSGQKGYPLGCRLTF